MPKADSIDSVRTDDAGSAESIRTVPPLARAAMIVAVLVGLAALLTASDLHAQTCVSDCNSDAEVTLGEVQTAFNIFLGTVLPGTCPSADANGDDEVTLGEVQTSFNQFLGSCMAPFAVAGPEAVEQAAKVGVQTASAFRVIGIGNIARSRGAGASDGRRWILAAALRAGLYGPAIGGGAGTVIPCSRGGTQEVACTSDATNSVRTVRYAACEERDADGNTRVREGFLSHDVADPGFCDTLQAPPDVVVTTETRDFVETTTTSDGTFLSRTGGSAVSRFEPAPGGCTDGPDGVEHVEGTMRFACNPQRVPDCRDGFSDVTMRARDLEVVRSSTGVPCALSADLSGELAIDNASTGDRFTQQLGSDAGAFRMLEIAQPDGATLLTQNGLTTVDCIGPLLFESDAEKPARFEQAASCFSDGELRISLAGDERARASRARPQSAVGAGAQSTTIGLVEHALRAANGQIYQVLQNPAGNDDLGIEDFRITTLVGSDDAVARCDSTQGSVFVPQAVVAAAPGTSLPVASARRSGIIPLSDVPCFNPNAAGGDGVVCLGPGCTRDCRCVAGCAMFTIGSGASLVNAGSGVPAARTAALGSLQAPCSGFTGQETYAFSAGSPTTEAQRCAPLPGDGLTLAAGSTFIVAYEAGFGLGFNTGSAGFGIDRDGSTECTGTNVVVTGAANRNELAPPRVRFLAAQGLEIDFNGDDFADKGFTRCLDIEAAPCVAPPPTAVPTPPVSPPCPQVALDSVVPLVRRDATRDQPNFIGGATCGDGGNRSRERTFGYTAPLDGFYTFETLGVGGLAAPFDTLLSVRADDCGGRELACNDNAEADRVQSRAGVSLQSGRRVVIVVDGSGVAEGDFELRISRSDVPPPATPTPTATPPSDIPDLVVVSVTAPAGGVVGGEIDVSATVRNAGGAAAGTSELTFVYARDAGLSEGRVGSGSSCGIAPLSPGATDGCALRIPVPASLASGTYFVGAVADATGQVSEANEANNEASSQAIALTGGGATPTQTVMSVATPTRTPPAIATPTRTPAKPTPTPTLTFTPSRTRTSSTPPSPTRTPTRTATAEETPTDTPEPTATETPGFCQITDCPACDTDGDSQVSEEEVNAAVDSALNGCPSGFADGGAGSIVPCPGDCNANQQVELSEALLCECLFPGSNCCVQQIGSGCDSPSCETCVCGLDDVCCSERWDDLCVALALDECSGSCACGFAPTPTPTRLPTRTSTRTATRTPTRTPTPFFGLQFMRGVDRLLLRALAVR